MALTATFAADLSGFTNSLKKGVVELQVFDRATKNATRGLKREVESFSGQKLAVEAARMTEAVERVGGISKLTESELRRVSATVNEFTAKMRAMGQEVPPHIAKLSSELTTLGHGAKSSGGFLSGLSGIAGKLGPILPVVSIAGAATALVSMGRAAFDSAGNISDLAAKTGLSTDAIQRMKAVADQTGTSLDTFTNAAFKLGVNLSEGTTKTRQAVAELGLEYGRLRAMKPEEQFATVVRALENVDSAQERNRLGTALFGKQFADMAAAVEQGYSQIADAASVSTNAQIQALDRAGDALAKFQHDVRTGLQSMLGNAVMTLQDIERGADALTVAQKAGIAVSTLWGENYLGALRDVGQALAAAEALQAGFTRQQQTASTAPTSAVIDYTKALQAATAEVAALSAGQRTQLNAALKIGADEAKTYAESIDLSAVALRLYSSQVKDGAKHTKDFAKEQEQSAKSLREFYNFVGERAIQAEAERQQATEQSAAALRQFYNWLGQREIEQTERVIDEQRKQTDARLKAIGEQEKSLREFHNWLGERRMQDDAAAMASTAAWRDELSTLASALSQLAQVSGGTFGGIVQWLATVIGSMDVAAKASETMRKGFDQLTGESKNVVAGLVNIAQGAIAAAAALLQATESGNTFQRTLGGIAAGAQAGSAFGPWGTAIGAVVGGLTGLFRGLFGVSDAIKQARLEVDKFQKDLHSTLNATQLNEAGGRSWAATLIAVRDAYLAVGRSAEEAERIVAQLLNTDNPEAAKRAMEEINRVMEEQKRLFEENQKAAQGLFDEIMGLAGDAGGVPDFMRPYIEQMIALGLLTDDQAEKLRNLGDSGETNWDKVKQAADKYGIRLESLGTPFNQQRITKDAAGIINAFDLIVKAGGDVGGVLFDLQDEISALVVDSKKFGTTIPANMKPWIEELFRAGLLIDEHGEKITDVSQIKYGDAIKTEAEKTREAFEKIIDKIQALIDKIAGPLQNAIDDIPRHIRIRADVDYNDDGFPRQRDPGDDVADPFAGSAPSSAAVGGRVSAALASASAPAMSYTVVPVFMPAGVDAATFEQLLAQAFPKVATTGRTRAVIRRIASLAQRR
jgi:hypothetical protein